MNTGFCWGHISLLWGGAIFGRLMEVGVPHYLPTKLASIS